VLYARLLDDCSADPDAAIRTIDAHQDEGDRLVRICMARVLPRLLATRPADALKRMRFFTRQEGGLSAEHQNVRRALVREPGELIALLDSAYDNAAESLLRVLVGDRDVHIRRALCDTLPALAAQSPEIALDLIEEYLLQDRDHFIQERTWNALRQLMAAGHERAEELCARLIEIA
jgi:hypothetical protein